MLLALEHGQVPIRPFDRTSYLTRWVSSRSITAQEWSDYIDSHERASRSQRIEPRRFRITGDGVEQRGK